MMSRMIDDQQRSDADVHARLRALTPKTRLPGGGLPRSRVHRCPDRPADRSWRSVSRSASRRRGARAAGRRTAGAAALEREQGSVGARGTRPCRRRCRRAPRPRGRARGSHRSPGAPAVSAVRAAAASFAGSQPHPAWALPGRGWPARRPPEPGGQGLRRAGWRRTRAPPAPGRRRRDDDDLERVHRYSLTSRSRRCEPTLRLTRCSALSTVLQSQPSCSPMST